MSDLRYHDTLRDFSSGSLKQAFLVGKCAHNRAHTHKTRQKILIKSMIYGDTHPSHNLKVAGSNPAPATKYP
jgi:hypothetical protein